MPLFPLKNSGANSVANVCLLLGQLGQTTEFALIVPFPVPATAIQSLTPFQAQRHIPFGQLSEEEIPARSLLRRPSGGFVGAAVVHPAGYN